VHGRRGDKKEEEMQEHRYELEMRKKRIVMH
jgi:hypothetical protein